MPEGSIIPFIALFILVSVAMIAWFLARSRRLLDEWAADNGITITSRERRYLRRGPFLWTTGRGQDVYYITAVDGSGTSRSGYVRCGSFWGGILSDKVTVEWD